MTRQHVTGWQALYRPAGRQHGAGTHRTKHEALDELGRDHAAILEGRLVDPRKTE